MVTGKKIKVQRKGCIYVLKMWLPLGKKDDEKGNNEASIFPRQAKKS